MKWIQATNLPPKYDPNGITRTVNGDISAGFYVREREYLTEGFDDAYDYIDENGYLEEGWYRKYYHGSTEYIVPDDAVYEYATTGPSSSDV